MYKAQRYSKPLVAINLKNEDELIDVHETDGTKEIFLTTYNGYALWFSEEEVTPIGTRAAGVKGINLKEGDFVTGGKIKDANEKPSIVIVTQRGAVKRMKMSEFELSSRAKRGVVILRELKANPHHVVGFVLANEQDNIFIETEKGLIETVSTRDLRYNDRYSNGSFLYDEADSGSAKHHLESRTRKRVNN